MINLREKSILSSCPTLSIHLLLEFMARFLPWVHLLEVLQLGSLKDQILILNTTQIMEIYQSKSQKTKFNQTMYILDMHRHSQQREEILDGLLRQVNHLD